MSSNKRWKGRGKVKRKKKKSKDKMDWITKGINITNRDKKSNRDSIKKSIMEIKTVGTDSKIVTTSRIKIVI